MGAAGRLDGIVLSAGGGVRARGTQAVDQAQRGTGDGELEAGRQGRTGGGGHAHTPAGEGGERGGMGVWACACRLGVGDGGVMVR